MPARFHNLLRRQFKRQFGEGFVVPEEWCGLARAVSDAYSEFDGDREMLERSLDLSSHELLQANSEMRAVFQAIPDLLFRLDQQGKILNVKAGDSGDLVIERRDFLGKRIQDTLLEHVAGQFGDALKRVSGGAAAVSIEYPMTLQGQESFYEARLVPIPDNQVITIIRNITERKQSLRLLGSAVEQATECIVITDTEPSEPKILFINPAFTKMTGYSAEEAAGKTLWFLQGPRTDQAVLSRLRESLAKGEVFKGETISYRKNGTEFDMDWQVAPIRNSNGTITHFLSIQRDITERRGAEEALQRLRDEHILILNSLGEGVHGMGLDGQITFENPASAAMLGYDVTDLIGLDAHAVLHHTRADGTPYPVEACPIHATLKDGLVHHARDEVFWRKDGSSFPVEYTSTALRDKDGAIIGATVVFTDITERKRLEAQVVQSQKLETVGKLAGGIAHEFNSIMTAIIGQSELLLQELPKGDPIAKKPAEIRKAAERAAVLTRQLLAYGRKQLLQPETLDLNHIIASMEGMFRHLMGSEVDVRILPAGGLKGVKADAGQIQQVIMNMAINARDAMPSGGRLTFETENVTLGEESAARAPDLKPGEYVMLAITDTGMGMTAELKARVFEPFFTTKGVGKGTGLGLATCYGILKQSGGHITVCSEPGLGTTFKIYLPQVEKETHAAPPPARNDLPRGKESIFLVEEDPALRKMAAILLARLGYNVSTAANGVEALSLAHSQDGRHIDLLFMDVVVSAISGEELAERMRAAYPRTLLLLTSANTEHAAAGQGVSNEGVAFIQKPFTPSTLALRVRDVLDKQLLTPWVPELTPV